MTSHAMLYRPHERDEEDLLSHDVDDDDDDGEQVARPQQEGRPTQTTRLSSPQIPPPYGLLISPSRSASLSPVGGMISSSSFRPIVLTNNIGDKTEQQRLVGTFPGFPIYYPVSC